MGHHDLLIQGQKLNPPDNHKKLPPVLRRFSGGHFSLSLTLRHLKVKTQLRDAYILLK